MASPLEQPSLPWRLGSALVMGAVGSITRVVLFGANRTEVHGLEKFLELLDGKRNIEGRQRGLVTVSNHVSVVDDPLLFGTLPFRYHFNPSNHRWGLGSHDICFTNKVLSSFFTLGQVIPIHRLAHSPFGGLFQPSMTEAVRLLSRPLLDTAPSDTDRPSFVNSSLRSPDITDPFSSPTHTYTTNGEDTFPAPSSYASRQYSWVHIFPEGRVHQHAKKTMRYFKWGVARLILEPDVCPDIVPIWIEGNDQIMHEAREWPRFIPRLGKRCGVWFGQNVGGEEGEGSHVFHELRKRWQDIVKRNRIRNGAADQETGILDDDLKYGSEAVKLREECTRQVRAAVLKVRRLRGLPDEDPKEGLVDTWRAEGSKREGRMEDGSWVKDV